MRRGGYRGRPRRRRTRRPARRLPRANRPRPSSRRRPRAGRPGGPRRVTGRRASVWSFRGRCAGRSRRLYLDDHIARPSSYSPGKENDAEPERIDYSEPLPARTRDLVRRRSGRRVRR
ncbi:hypothetical protein ELQ92_13385 [Labedella populi]|uniref:Uncharacterized protein n=1 Tax=Labedella populi TaxID=2498850 RepID=A0A444Q603_9MICO|nr:hypothetical protein ELQ92_13385 [Labedella populi]